MISWFIIIIIIFYLRVRPLPKALLSNIYLKTEGVLRWKLRRVGDSYRIVTAQKTRTTGRNTSTSFCLSMFLPFVLVFCAVTVRYLEGTPCCFVEAQRKNISCIQLPGRIIKTLDEGWRIKQRTAWPTRPVERDHWSRWAWQNQQNALTDWLTARLRVAVSSG